MAESGDKKIGKDTDTTDPDSLADQPLPKRRRTDRHEHESEGNVAADRVAVEKQAGGGKADSESDRTLKRTGQYYSDHSYLNRLSRQERRRIEGEIIKGRKPGETQYVYVLTY